MVNQKKTVTQFAPLDFAGACIAATLALILGGKYVVDHALPQIVDELPVPTVIIGAGFEIKVGSEVAKVFGHDEYACGDNTCKGLKLEEGSKEVTLVIAGKRIEEHWTIAKVNHVLAARRPNGEYVRPAK